jgi:hypothetical protein
MNTLYAEIVCAITDALDKDYNMIVRIQTCHPQKLPKKFRETFIPLPFHLPNKLVT